MTSQIKNITPNNNTKISHQLQFYNILNHQNSLVRETFRY